MDASKLRQRVQRLDQQRGALLTQLMRVRGRMVVGSLYQMRRCCGNPNCKCARGEKHVSWYLSRGVQGRTKLVYIGRVVPAWLSERVQRHQRYQRLLAQVRKLDGDISVCLNELRACYAQTPEEALKKEK